MKMIEFKAEVERILERFDANSAVDLVHDALGNMNELMAVCRKLVETEAVDRDEREAALNNIEIARAHLDSGALEEHLSVKGMVCHQAVLEAAEVLARPVPRASRWVVLPFTSGSGKMLFRCGVCGRLSNTPDKRCQDKWGCEEYDGEPGMMNPAPEGFR